MKKEGLTTEFKREYIDDIKKRSSLLPTQTVEQSTSVWTTTASPLA